MGKYALLIGVGSYGQGLPALPAAPNDVAAMREVLLDPQMGSFDEAKSLINPTQPEMAREIELWFQDRRPDDLMLLFFSGHGIKDGRRNLYFAATDTEKQRNLLLTSTTISARFIHDCIRHCRAKSQVLVLDCCFSGAFGELIARDGGEVNLKEQLAAQGCVVLTSTSGVDYAFEEKGAALSIYTRYLVEGIATGIADENRDGTITIDELHRYAARKVKETSSTMSPDIITLKGEGFRLPIARSPHRNPTLLHRREAERKTIAGKRTASITALKNDALKAEVEGDVETARHLWIQVLTVSPGDVDAVSGIERLSRGGSSKKRFLSRNSSKPRSAVSFFPFGKSSRQGGTAPNSLEKQRSSLPTAQPSLQTQYQQRRKLWDVADSFPITRRQAIRLLGVTGGGLGSIVISRVVFQFTRQPSTSSTPILTINDLTPVEFQTAKVGTTDEIINQETLQGHALIETIGNSILELIPIPGGDFQMGSSEEKEGRENEHPQHPVSVPPFLMGRYEVTQSQWSAVSALPQIERTLPMEPASYKGDNHPVEGVDWDDTIEFCRRLTQHTGREYRLPSEAEWEYACRAGTTGQFYFGETLVAEVANYVVNSKFGDYPSDEWRQEPIEVGSFPANAFGLYDMHGNLWEWCQDTWHDNYIGAPVDGSAWVTDGPNEERILRGGAWGNDLGGCRSANRFKGVRDRKDTNIGFRVVCTAPWTLS